MAIKPLADNLVVEPMEEESTTPGGIVLPDTAKEKPAKGKIIAVGPGRMNKDGNRIAVDSALQPGVIVLFKKYSTTEIKQDGKDLFIIDEDGILAIEQ